MTDKEKEKNEQNQKSQSSNQCNLLYTGFLHFRSINGKMCDICFEFSAKKSQKRKPLDMIKLTTECDLDGDCIACESNSLPVLRLNYKATW